MDVQTIFYTMGIIFMAVMFVFMIALIVIIIYIKNKISELERNVREKVELVSNVSQLGGKAVEAAVGKIKDFVDSKNTKKKN